MLLLAVDDNDGDGDDVTTIETPGVGVGDGFTEEVQENNFDLDLN